MLKFQERKLVAIHVAVDVAATTLAWLLAYALRFYADAVSWLLPVTKGVPELSRYVLLLPFMAVLWPVVPYFHGLYQMKRGRSHDLNSEFYVSHSTGIFLHPSPGIGSELAQTGLNGPSVFPTSSVGLHVSVFPTPETYVQAVVLDGVPGDPDNPRGTHIQFNDGDGTLRVFEVGYIPGKSKNGDQADRQVCRRRLVLHFAVRGSGGGRWER